MLTTFLFSYFSVFVGIATDVITFALGFMCMRNFDKGLKPFVQRGRNKQKLQQDLEMNQKNQSRQSWRIDDD